MVCEYCDNEVPAGALHCPSCGAALKVQSAVQIVQSPQIVVSPQPTAPVHVQPTASGASTQSVVERKSRVAYVLLGIFLGGLGIHNFYAGRPGRALGQLLTTLLAGWLVLPLIAVGIWVLCDVCAITTDGNGNKFQ